MPVMASSGTWLTLKEASSLLGVHPGTLRSWADQGQVPVFRTPGGHRRFLRADIEALLPKAAGATAETPAPELQLTNVAVVRVHQDLGVGGSEDRSWLATVDEVERAMWREAGKRLAALAIQFVARHNGQQAIIQEVQQIGRLYGQLAARHKVHLAEVARTFFFFRDSVLNAVCPVAPTALPYDEEAARIRLAMGGLFETAFYALLDAFESQHLNGGENHR